MIPIVSLMYFNPILSDIQGDICLGMVRFEVTFEVRVMVRVIVRFREQLVNII